MLEEHQAVIERLCTIPGVAERTAQVMIAECGLDMARFPTVGHFASWAGIRPGHHESAGRRRSGRHPARAALADRGAHRIGEGRCQDQGHLPGRPSRPDPRAPRRGQGDRGDPPRHPRRLLPHRPRRGRVPRARPRLAAQALLPRAPRPASTAPDRSARLPGHPPAQPGDRPRRLNATTSTLAL